MLSRITKRLPTFYYQQYRFFAAASPSDAFNDRISSLRSSYPNLFDQQSFISDQEQLLSEYRSNLSSLLSEYESARQQITTSSTNENVFVPFDESELLNDLNSRNKPFYESVTDSTDTDDKLSEGQKYVNKIIELQSEQESASSIEEKNLKMIEIANYSDKIDEWMLRFPDPLNDSSDLGLPINDEELDEWVREQYHHAPDEVREQGLLSYDQHKDVEEKWMKTLDDKLIDILKGRDSNFDEDKFMEFCNVTNEMFHPHSIDHYGMSNYSKSLFRAALWQSKDRCNSVEQSISILYNLLEDGRDDDASIMRGMYEQNPDNTRFKEFAAFQLQINDPLFSAKLIQEIRLRLEHFAIDRAQKDVLYDLQVPYLQNERNELERELEESMSTNPANMKRGIEVLQKEEDLFNIEVPALEDVLDDILTRKLWNNDINGVKQAIISYAKGNGSLNDINKAIQESLKPNCSGDLGGVSDSEILDISVKYHNSRYSSSQNYNFNDFLMYTTTTKDAASILENRRIVASKLNKLGIDPLVINLVRIIIEDGTATTLNKICCDYLDIMKRFRGEIEGFITSASQLDENIFNQIKEAIESANPGKKITLQQLIDPGVQSGFIVKAGVQRFDFSLATVIHSGRTAVASQ